MTKTRLFPALVLIGAVLLAPPAWSIPIDVGVQLRADWDFSSDPVAPPYTNGSLGFEATGVTAGDRYRYSFYDTADNLLGSQIVSIPVSGAYISLSAGTPFFSAFAGSTGYLLLEGLLGSFEILNPRIQLSRYEGGFNFLRTANQGVTFHPVGTASVPEPFTLSLVAAGLLLLAARRTVGD